MSLSSIHNAKYLPISAPCLEQLRELYGLTGLAECTSKELIAWE